MPDFVSTRELARQPGKIMRKAAACGPQIITQNGVPAAYLLPASGLGIERDLDLLRRLMLARALAAAQTEAAKAGPNGLSQAEIDREIAAARRARRARASVRKDG